MNPAPLVSRHRDEGDAWRAAEAFIERVLEPLRGVEPLLRIDRNRGTYESDQEGARDGGTLRLWRQESLIAIATVVRDDRNFSVLVCQEITEPVPPLRAPDEDSVGPVCGEVASPVRIACAAVKYRGMTFSLPRPNRHHNIVHAMHDLGVGVAPRRVQGFLTSEGIFVTREEAALIAEAAGQIHKGRQHARDLFSEDLW